jgi:hypothetical protein
MLEDVIHDHIATGRGGMPLDVLSAAEMTNFPLTSGGGAALAERLSGTVALISSFRVPEEINGLMGDADGELTVVPILCGEGPSELANPPAPALQVPSISGSTFDRPDGSRRPLHSMLLLALLLVAGKYYLVVQNSWSRLRFFLIEYEFFVACEGRVAFATKPIVCFRDGPPSSGDRFVSLPAGVAAMPEPFWFIPPM